MKKTFFIVSIALGCMLISTTSCKDDKKEAVIPVVNTDSIAKAERQKAAEQYQDSMNRLKEINDSLQLLHNDSTKTTDSTSIKLGTDSTGNKTTDSSVVVNPGKNPPELTKQPGGNQKPKQPGGNKPKPGKTPPAKNKKNGNNGGGGKSASRGDSPGGINYKRSDIE